MANAVIMAAGMSSRFVPLCWERPKALLEVKGEILIERQIRQLKEAGVSDITIVTGYMADKFSYLKDKFGVSLVNNSDYSRYNNTSTLMRVLDKLQDTWLCSSDNYFTENVFMERPSCSQYSAEWSEGETDEYCMYGDKDDNIIKVTVGGFHVWYMIGHVFFNSEFSSAYKRILVEEYKNPATRQGYWEDVYVRHVNDLPHMRMRKFPPGVINEFDSLEDLRKFDRSYVSDARSEMMERICERLKCNQKDINEIQKFKQEEYRYSFKFNLNDSIYVLKSNDLKQLIISKE